MHSDIITADFSDRITTFLKRLGGSGWGWGVVKKLVIFCGRPKNING